MMSGTESLLLNHIRRLDSNNIDDDTFFIPRSSSVAKNVRRLRRDHGGSAAPPITWHNIDLFDRSRASKSTVDDKTAPNPVTPQLKSNFRSHSEELVMMAPEDPNRLSRVPLGSRSGSIVDDLLGSIYSQIEPRRRTSSVDSDTFTEYSTTSDCHNLRKIDNVLRYSKASLLSKRMFTTFVIGRIYCNGMYPYFKYLFFLRQWQWQFRESVSMTVYERNIS